MVFNKVDLFENGEGLRGWSERYPDGVAAALGKDSSRFC